MNDNSIYAATTHNARLELKRAKRDDVSISAGSILDISKYRDTCERSISILDGIAILRYIEYRMIRRYLDDISYDPRYLPIRYLNNRRYGSIARKPRYRDTYY